MKQVKESFGKDRVKWLKDCCGNHEAAEKNPLEQGEECFSNYEAAEKNMVKRLTIYYVE